MAYIHDIRPPDGELDQAITLPNDQMLEVFGEEPTADIVILIYTKVDMNTISRVQKRMINSMSNNLSTQLITEWTRVTITG